VRSSNAPTVFADIASHEEDVRDGPAARLAEDDVCSPDAAFCELREPVGKVLLVGIGHVLRG
jgi:hypothetical protein